jgi:hypothetical protein
VAYIYIYISIAHYITGLTESQKLLPHLIRQQGLVKTGLLNLLVFITGLVITVADGGCWWPGGSGSADGRGRPLLRCALAGQGTTLASWCGTLGGGGIAVREKRLDARALGGGLKNTSQVSRHLILAMHTSCDATNPC